MPTASAMRCPAGVLPAGTALTLGIGANSGSLDMSGVSAQVSALATSGAGPSNDVTNTAVATSTLTVTAATNQTYAGTLSGNVQLAKAGAATLTLTNPANCYTGDAVVNAGTLKIGAAGA